VPPSATDNGARGGYDAAFDSGGGDQTPAPVTSTDLAGMVVDFETTRPLAGRTVYVGSQSTTTASDGTFRVAGIGSSYDAVVIDPDGTSISIYKGLSRRDPVLSHQRLPPETAHRATLNGDVSGGGNYPLAPTDSVDIYFFSADADNQFSIGRGLPANLQGPGFGPMHLDWDGADSVSGHLMALGVFPTAGGVGAWFVDEPIRLYDGQDAFVNVALASVVTSGQIAGTIETPPHWPVAGKAVFYRLPIVHAAVRIPVAQTPATIFETTVPDLSELGGGQLCAEVESASDATPGSAVTEVCGLTLGQTGFVLTVEPPPTLVTPTSTTTLTNATEFSWIAFDHGVHLLDLVSAAPSRSLPNVHVFTPETSLVWPDLRPVGVSFPANASYSVTIAGLGPYADINEALGSAGIAAQIAAERRRSYSNTLYLATGS
jgi:hypothetical protein